MALIKVEEMSTTLRLKRMRGSDVADIFFEACAVVFGVLVIIGGLQLEGWYRLLSLAGLYLMAAVCDETIINPMIHWHHH